MSVFVFISITIISTTSFTYWKHMIGAILMSNATFCAKIINLGTYIQTYTDSTKVTKKSETMKSRSTFFVCLSFAQIFATGSCDYSKC